MPLLVKEGGKKENSAGRRGAMGHFYTKLIGNDPGICGKSAKAALPCMHSVSLNH